MHFVDSIQRDLLLTPNIISSTYIYTSKRSLPFLFVKRVVLSLSMLKSFSMRKVFNLSYQALSACFKPYKAFLSLKHDQVNESFQTLKVAQHTHFP